ncbi:MAG TPA: hypothetical protein VF179_06990 [Thermoanaerobaculia bacterium]|nr:hypothetical protein [Thermoanaerobaculia bacterium]
MEPLIDALRKLLSSEIPVSLWDGNVLVVLMLSALAVGIAFWKSFFGEMAKRFAQYASNGQRPKFLFLYGFSLLVCLAAGYWRTMVLVIVCALLVWWQRRHSRIEKAGWRLVAAQVGAFVLAATAEELYKVHQETVQNSESQVYVVLSFQGGGLENEAQLRKISSRFRVTLNTAFHGLVKVQPQEHDSDWLYPDAALEHLKPLHLDPDLVLFNTAEIERDGKHVQTITLLSELKIPRPGPNGISYEDKGFSQAVSRIRGDRQLTYLTLALTMDLLSKLRAQEFVKLSPQQELVTCLRLGELFRSRARLDRPQPEVLQRIDSALARKSLTSVDLQAWVTDQLNPPDPQTARNANQANRAGTRKKLTGS